MRTTPPPLAARGDDGKREADVVEIAQSNQAHDFKKWVTIPADAPLGRGIVTASLTSLYGAVAYPVISNFNVTVAFGGATSDNYVTSR